MENEKSAKIRNLLQRIKTSLELLSQDKAVPKKFLQEALKDLKTIEEIL